MLLAVDAIEHLAHEQGYRRLVGVDEAGRGPWAGPVVAAAVMLSSVPLPVRIDDSKRLTPRQRGRACELILRRAAVGVGITSAEEIDRVNILHGTLLAMRRAIESLPSASDLILVDGPATPPVQIPCWPVIGGDRRSYAIACASIVAKVVRDRLMTFYQGLYPEYQFARHKGYGTSLHRRLLRRLGPSFLHRMSVEPVRATAHHWQVDRA